MSLKKTNKSIMTRKNEKDKGKINRQPCSIEMGCLFFDKEKILGFPRI